MKLSLLIFLLLSIPLSAFGQLKEYVIETDTSKIKVTENISNVITEEQIYLTGNVHHKVFYSDKTIYEDGWQDSSENRFGVWNYFTPKGQLIRSINYTKSTWEYDKQFYPYIGFLDSILARANSLIINTYSREFFDDHVIFDPVDSRLYHNNDEWLGDWTDPVTERPNSFFLRYKIRFDPEHVYDRAIQFELDSLGNYIPQDYFQFGPLASYGFENVKSPDRSFTISYSTAIQKAKLAGLIETDSNKALGFLKFERSPEVGFFDGEYRFYITIKTACIQQLVPEGRSSITNKFDVYSFNPWTSEFVEKKKMKIITLWEGIDSSETGLIPD